MDADKVKMMSGEDLDAAGAVMSPAIARVSRAHGHAFDEADDSYRRRLLAELVGPVAAGAMSQPPMIEGAGGPGPTIAEWVDAGYLAKNYPPRGYASRSTAEEIAAAIAKQDAEHEAAADALAAKQAAAKAKADEEAAAKMKSEAGDGSSKVDAAAMAAKAAKGADQKAADAEAANADANKADAAKSDSKTATAGSALP